MNKLLFLLFSVFLLSSCTYNVTLVHTEGAASDVVDDTPTITPTANVSVPVSAF